MDGDECCAGEVSGGPAEPLSRGDSAVSCGFPVFGGFVVCRPRGQDARWYSLIGRDGARASKCPGQEPMKPIPRGIPG